MKNNLANIAVALLVAVIAPGVLAEETSALDEAANRFLTMLSDEQAERAQFEFGGDERENWHFFPKHRGGIATGDLNTPQLMMAAELLNQILSEQGFAKVTGVIALEGILQQIELADGKESARERRSPDKYYISIFGKPAAKGLWGFRLEGHHLSVNVTIADGEVVSTTPFFLGGNPHEVREGEFKGYRPLAAEEDIARELVSSLTADQKKIAILSDEAPADILTGADRKAEMKGEPQGLKAADMTEEQVDILRRLGDAYVNNLHPLVRQARLDQIESLTYEELDSICFAWMGGTEPGEPHYYRVHAPTFVVEYDNIQNNANHSHIVWRSFEGDFGRDVLADHHKVAHTR